MQKPTANTYVPDVHKTSFIKELEPVKETKVSFDLAKIFVAVAIILVGTLTGFILTQGKNSQSATKTAGGTSGGVLKVVGPDESKFKDKPAEGVLREGGIGNEGTHHLERPGGESQYVYLTSSTIPLDDYVGKKIKVWGETFSASKAGWFMDVGRLELLE